MKTIYKATHFSSHYRGGKAEYSGTIPQLVEVFAYTLECGHSRDAKIPTSPRTSRTLEDALNNSALACGRYSEAYFIRK